MKKTYWFLLLFGLWCVGSGYWYMFTMKGLRTDPRFFDPHVSTMAILEILVMVMVACLIGYAIGWGLRDEHIASMREMVDELKMDKQTMVSDQRAKEEHLQLLEQQKLYAQQAGTLKWNKAKQETDLLVKELSELKQELTHMKESAATPAGLQQLENEVGALRYRFKQLEFQNQELEENNRRLKNELQESVVNQNQKSYTEPMHPFVRPVEMHERNDLTLIKGIGPFIEKRLNMIGIYTYHQISEFTPEIIEHVTKAIEFFPNRILRDNWVGQAKKLL